MKDERGQEMYGTEVRPWPREPCGHEPPCGIGYFSDSRWVFERWFAQVGRYHLLVHQREDGPWDWQVGAFSWTPDGDLWDTHHFGTNATRTIAEAEARTCALNTIRRYEEYVRESRERDAARSAV